MSIFVSAMTVAGVATDMFSGPGGQRTTLNLNVVNDHAEGESVVDVFMVPKRDVGVFSVAVDTQGSGYVAIPTITEEAADGSGAVYAVVMEADAATCIDAGTGYQVGDVLHVSGGDTAATITVDDVDGNGVIQAVSLTTGGAYTTLPATPAATTGGNGSGATFAMTYRVKAVNITTKGGGYAVAPTLSVDSGTATLTATIGATPQRHHKIEPTTIFAPRAMLYRTALVFGPGDKLYVHSDTADVVVTAWGAQSLA
jgi:hypothetical protein